MSGRVLRMMALLGALAGLAGCATQASSDGAQAPLARIEQSVVVGQSSKAQVLAALGPTTTVAFDSGVEVWLYRYQPAGMTKDAAGEFVILFDAQGIVRKTRQRDPDVAPP